MKTIKIPSHKVVSREEWLKARKTHLAKENSSPGNAMSLAGSAASYPGSRSKALWVRRSEGQGDARRPLRWAQPTDRLSFHVRP